MYEINTDLNINDFELSEIVSIEFIGEEDTIDITVEDTHMFFANGIYTHNSGAKAELNDTDTIGKAIEPFQVADMLWTFTQSPEMKAQGKCLVYLIKNRLGPNGIVIESYYDPNKGTFEEIGDVSEILLLNDKDKKQVKVAVTDIREKLKSGAFDSKK